MNSIDLRPATDFPTPQLAELFTRCYAGYFTSIGLDATAFEAMTAAQQIDRSASRVALRDGEPVGVALLGIRAERGWIGGMGIVAEARGMKLGEQLMQSVLASARARSLRSVDLEVLIENTRAAVIYERLGFRDVRRLEVLGRDAAPAPDLPAHAGAGSIALDDVFSAWDRLRSERSPWQRDRPALEHWAPSLRAIGVHVDGGLACAAVFRIAPERGSLVDIGVAPNGAPAPLRAVLSAAISQAPETPWMMLNLPPTHPAHPPMLELGFTVRHAQREMSVEL